jgi:hypothetical protein
MPDTIAVVVVARTKMGGGRVCIGALSRDGEHLRMMTPQCTSPYAADCAFQVGERWKIECAPCGDHKEPHVEDVAVTQAERVGTVTDLVEYILQRADPWKGPITNLFEGKIQFTNNGAGYISQSDVPPGATGFWIPSSDLMLKKDNRGHSGYYPKRDHRHLSYVGVQNAIECIPAETLVRVSLARWWKPDDADDDLEERCYVQISGWY